MILLSRLAIYLITFLLSLTLVVSGVSAIATEDPITDEAEMVLADDTNNATPEGKIKKLVEERLKAIADPNASSSANPSNIFGGYGILDKISDTSLELTNPHTNYKFIVKLDPKPTIANLIDKGENEISPEYAGKTAIVIGQSSPEGEIQAIKVTLIAKIPALTKTIVGGEIEKLDDDEFELTTTNGSTTTVTVDKNTSYKVQNQKAEPSFDDLAVGDFVFLTAEKTDKTDTYEALSILVKPNNNLTEVSQTPDPTPTTIDKPSTCGDGICQDTACLSLDCPDPETTASCPEDCSIADEEAKE